MHNTQWVIDQIDSKSVSSIRWSSLISQAFLDAYTLSTDKNINHDYYVSF